MVQFESAIDYLKFILVINTMSLFVLHVFDAILGKVKDWYAIWVIVDSTACLKKTEVCDFGHCCAFCIDEEIIYVS